MLKAKRVSDNADVLATEVTRGPEYRCPECNQLVIIRKGPKVIHHFAHRTDASCAYGRGETQAHLRAKLMLRDAFRGQGFKTPHSHLGPMANGLSAWLLAPKDDKRPSRRKILRPQSPPAFSRSQSPPAFLKALWRRAARSRGGPRL